MTYCREQQQQVFVFGLVVFACLRMSQAVVAYIICVSLVKSSVYICEAKPDLLDILMSTQA